MQIDVVSLRSAVPPPPFLRRGLAFLLGSIPMQGRAQDAVTANAAASGNDAVVVHFRPVPPDADDVGSDAKCAFRERARILLSTGHLLIGGHVACGTAAVRSVLFLSAQGHEQGPTSRRTDGVPIPVPRATGDAPRRGRDAVVFREVAPTRLRATITHLVLAEGGRIFAARSSAVESAGRDDVLSSRDGGVTWDVRGGIPKGPSSAHALLVGFAARAGGGVVAATRHEPGGRDAVVVCHGSNEGSRWEFLHVLPYETPTEREPGGWPACPGMVKEPPPPNAAPGMALPESFPARKAWRRTKK